VLEWNEQPSPFSGGVADVGLFTAGIQAPAPGLAATAPNAEIPFSMVIGMNGTRDLRFLPAAQETTIGLTSRWPHPGFTGSPLPQTRTTGDAGFTAQWTAMDFGRSYPAVWTSAEMDRKELLAKADASAFGVSLLQPVDIYHQTERAVKYAALFIVLTFLVFFLWELFQAALLHPVQYAFVGFALCLYYLLLVSLSEHVGFDTAYVISSVCATALIGGYSRAVLHGTMRAASVIASLAALYGFLFLLLRLEDYALVAGAAGLFAVLALVMFVTRRMDWYDLRLGTRGTEAVVK
jgi:inner membrane protein